MKVCAISGDKKFLRLGETFEKSRWYRVPDELDNTVSAINRNDTVEIKSEQEPNGKLILTALKKTGSAPPSPATGTGSGTERKYWGKSPEERADIKRQAIGNMTSRGLIALQGQVDINNINSIAESLYKKFQQLVG